MDDIAAYCSWADAHLDSQISTSTNLPIEIRALIVQATSPHYLDAITKTLRDTRYTDSLFPLYKPLLPEILARWMDATLSSNFYQSIQTLSSLGRLLPLATYLSPYLRSLIGSEPLKDCLLGAETFSELEDAIAQTILLALFRCLSFERDMLADSVGPSFFTSFLDHASLPVRYLAIQCLCMNMHFADDYSENLVETYIGKQAILGTWEGKSIDYRLLKLWEERRWKDLVKAAKSVEEAWQAVPSSLFSSRNLTVTDLSPRTVNLGGVLYPQSPDRTISPQESAFVLTSTAKQNLHQLGKCLLGRKPILVSGEAGSGKTSLVHEAARLLGERASMVTLHLNEQIDAKSLLGIHTSSADGKSFIWQPGVLTKAMQQGRWILIEDIDRAPAEVLGVLRPILENGELFLPSRKEKIRPKADFRILATMRISGKPSSTTTSRFSWLHNDRIWNTVDTSAYTIEEIDIILRTRFPLADVFIPVLSRAHTNLLRLYETHLLLKGRQTRLPTVRDLLNLSRRTARRLDTIGVVVNSTPLPEHIKVGIFIDAVDCYAGRLDTEDLHDLVAGNIATSMGVSPQQMRYYSNEALKDVSENNGTVQLGRSTLQKTSSHRRHLKKAPFALTTTTRRALDRIAASIECSEPCLLVGETGVGKTTMVQHVANLVGQVLTVINLSQQSEAADLLGGLKPVTTRSLILPVVDKFNTLFDDTFSAKRNEKFQIALAKAIAKQNWSRLMILWEQAVQMAAASLKAAEIANVDQTVHITKKRKLETPRYEALRERWADFSESFKQIRSFVDQGDKTHAFAFVEGRLVQAVREGEWILLDEINLAPSDTLDHIAGLLQNTSDGQPSLLLAEAGDIQTIVAHPDFRLLAAMNPATDAGKKDLAPGLRSRFTEIYVPSGDGNLEDLNLIIQSYLGSQLDSDKRAALDLAKSYLALKTLNEQHQLTDGAGEAPHFSIRSLVRCLLYVSQHGASHGLRRAMYEGFAMSFFTVLSRASENLALPYLDSHLLSKVKNRKAFFTQQPQLPPDADEFTAFRRHLVKKGPMTPDSQPRYIRTPSVERNLLNLARAASMRQFPILLQGPTSTGKTSMVEYLAKLSGNKFVRINNHEHTDLQEYLGSYVSDADGKLVYREGVLVDALRLGHWIVLDELNLAPSDVLEALNRLLDDNRELFIPESQETIRPHPNFMLFATQNPAGLYGGRKRLSRAFRNRFLEIHFDDIPEDELEVILRERTQIAPPFCTKIVAVYKSLSLLRQSSRLFEQRNSFATLRDLFRWASRPVDDWQSLAYHGFMLLAERVRDPVERTIVKKILEKEIKVKLDESVLYAMENIPCTIQNAGPILWTPAMRRAYVLVAEALKNKEPVLLVGETGCGKTQICQVIAEAFQRPLDIYNAHTNTETGDLIGSQRPVRNHFELTSEVHASWQALQAAHGEDSMQEDLAIHQIIEQYSRLDRSKYDAGAVERLRISIGAYQALFAWSDGSLVRAMKKGEHFLLDEISLAEDSVLERLNSVLEPSRTILLAEKGSVDNLVTADPDFQFLATMNPGGDYGKRELSAALRNRLTEIWIPPLSQQTDVLPIVEKKLCLNRRHLAPKMLDFALWFRAEFHNAEANNIALRDLLAWAEFINRAGSLEQNSAFVQGALMVYVDSIGANPAGMTPLGSMDLSQSRERCWNRLQDMTRLNVVEEYRQTPKLLTTDTQLSVGPFSLPRGQGSTAIPSDLVFDAPTTLKNTMRIVRALQMTRPILLEGSPGVGKTAIVTALAQACGKEFARVNLSDQTDLMDLFGADAPSTEEQMGKFSWQDGPLLKAMQTGGWVLLDEMNLASQSVLEGLNACLDHRREIYIAELDKSFTCHPEFTLFAAQNPHHQGGGRKGLPASFVNRFTIVYADAFEPEDLMRICRSQSPDFNNEKLESLVNAATQIGSVIARTPTFSQGGPWDVNLRDINRWLQLCRDQPTLPLSYHLRTVITQRFHTFAAGRTILAEVEKVLESTSPQSFYNNLSRISTQIGTAFLPRDLVEQKSPTPKSGLSVEQLPIANSIITAVKHNWPVIVAGPSGAGKTTLIRYLAAAAGAELVEFSMSADVDAMDLVGGFEQYDLRRDVATFQAKVRRTLRPRIAECIRAGGDEHALMHLLRIWHYFGSDDLKTEDVQTTLPTLSTLLPELDTAIETISSALQNVDRTGFRFVWNDGILVDALESGSWLLLDNANLCNPAVLDRLNSLLEPDGVLTISEHLNGGDDTRTIEPHPNFRIFMTMDPQYGELSRAMRNRSLEVFLPEVFQAQPDQAPVQYPLSSNVNRLRLLSNFSDARTMEVSIDNLNDEDLSLISTVALSLPDVQDREELATELLVREALDVDLVRQISGLSVATLANWPQLSVLNEPLVLLNQEMSSEGQPQKGAELFIRAWYVARKIAELVTALKNAAVRAKTFALKDRTVFERSVSVTKSKSLGSSPNVTAFAQLAISSISAIITQRTDNKQMILLLRATENVLAFVQAVVSYCNKQHINNAHFDAYLHVGTEIAHTVSRDFPNLASVFEDCLRTLTVQDNALVTGFGLQLMWPTFRPTTPATSSDLNTRLRLEDLIVKFDQICQYLPESRNSLSRIRSNLRHTYRSIVESNHPGSSLQVLQDAVNELEVQSKEGFKLEGKFEDVIGFIHGVALMGEVAQNDADTALLSMFAPKLESHELDLGHQNPVPASLIRLASMDVRVLKENGPVALKLTQHLATAQRQPLGRLNHATEELQVLAQALTSHNDALGNLRSLFTRHLRVVFSGIMWSHRELLKRRALSYFNDEGLLDFAGLATATARGVILLREARSPFGEVYSNLLHPVLLHLATPAGKEESPGPCLINLSLAGLFLMVPDKLFDPATFPAVAHHFHEGRVAKLSGSIEGQRWFHQLSTGQDTALIIRILEQDLLELGTSIPPPILFRPGKEEHFKLQQVFTRIVNVLLTDQDDRNGRFIPAGSAEWIEQWSTPRVKSNLKSLIERLEHVHRAYDDFSKPILWFLKCLYLGLELLDVNFLQNSARNAVDEISDATPLLSEHPDAVQDWRLNGSSMVDLKVLWLEHTALRSTLVDVRYNLPIDDFLDVLENFYHDWKTRLTREQAEAVTRSRYYTYRGNSTLEEEQDDSEMSEMFPNFDDDEVSVDTHQDFADARTTAIKLSTLHQKIYAKQDPREAMQAFILSALTALPNDTPNATSEAGALFTGLLPAIMLQMESKMSELTSGHQNQDFNIYTDADIAQTRRLFELVRHIQQRFRAIRTKWPEHAVPADVLSFCNEVLHLNLDDPLAKYLTKVEKLYEMVCQWQSVASREWSVVELVENISSLIISWRRSELLSWSRLLDEEETRHTDDAQAWYFIAYEAVIHNSQIADVDDQSLQPYRTTLAQTLEEFFRTTTLGQYSSRLRLLETLNKTLWGMAVGQEHLRKTAASVQHVIEYYQRYEAGLKISLQNGRTELEKALTEQIKLASWKDTNITALRESARRSHHKLFKIVRKYRALLNKAVVLTPLEETSLQPSTVLTTEPSLPQTAAYQVETAVEQCQQQVHDWNQRPERLKNPLGAARSMRHLYASTMTDLQAQNALTSFRQELTENISDLRNQTPSTLTEDNASLVRHLQEHKRRLLADTLKQVAHMGVRRNLPTSELERQSSTAKILALSPDVIADRSIFESVDDSGFHDLLDIMPQVRSARTEHSDDLTDGEVNRGVGLLEGLLSTAIRQRQVIPQQEADVRKLASQLALVRSVISLTLSGSGGSTKSMKQVKIARDRLAWLAEILALGCRVLKFQSEHSGLDFQDLIDTVHTHAVEFRSITQEFDDLPDSPAGLIWTTSETLLDKASCLLARLDSILRQWQVKEPRAEFLLSKIIVWTSKSISSENQEESQTKVTFHELDRDLRMVLDQIFVALQRLPAAFSAMPISEEDPGWLAKSERCIGEAIRSLQVSTIVQSLDQCILSRLQYLATADLEVAKHLLTVAMPILEQFNRICEHLQSHHAATHSATCRLTLKLAQSFTMLASQGFCRPHDPAEGKEEQSGKLESGTGLGEGGGAEDISKDIQDEEDLSELAQQGQKEERDEEMENADDAVDMGHEDLEGEMGDLDHKSDQEDDKDQSGDEDENKVDEEAGSVDDLDPDAVDDKMWDDLKMKSEQNDKEMKNDKAKGDKSDDQTAADGEKAEDEDLEGVDGDEQEMDDESQKGDEGGERPEGEQLDSHVEEEKALDLPEELNLAGEDDVKADDLSEDGMGELSDIDDQAEGTSGQDVEDAGDTEKQDQPWDENAADDEIDAEDPEAENCVGQDDAIMEDQPEEPEDDAQVDHDTRETETAHDVDENTGGESGAANEIQDDIGADQTAEGMNEVDKDPNPQQSLPSKASENDKEGQTGKGVVERGAGLTENIEHQQNESLRKLADVLDQWHQRREILPISEQEDQDGPPQQDIDMADADFEHVQKEDEGSAQALGAAGADQAQNLDQSKAIEEAEMPVDDDTALPEIADPEVEEDIAERYSRLKAQARSTESKEAGALIPDRQPQTNRTADLQDDMDAVSEDLSPSIEQLELRNDSSLTTTEPTTTTTAAQLWHQCSTTTHQFSLLLTEQLRLILSPTTATKLRGDYRTGKRLNIKRIIPYIASNYKRDKIWMRRSVPSKRHYQIMIAVDDSKSMSESGADILAFETLALLTKSLAMLEAGDICVVGFGDTPQITIAHPFGVPFSRNESGPNIFRAFSFQQRGTDVKSLVAQSIQLFRDARNRNQHSGADEQWQLQLILSDGHISDHAAIARLVRQANDAENRIVIVFVIVDAGQESILDLKEAVYERDSTSASGASTSEAAMGVGEGAAKGKGEMKLSMKRYLDGFPFPYYLVVRDVRELPGVLATALKGWFGSVVEVR